MVKLNSLISDRLKNKEPSAKMAYLAEKSATGALSTFQGVFKPSELTPFEKEQLEGILSGFAEGNGINQKDLLELTAITSEVKAINHQGALLHGERIQRARDLLKKYQEGAFSAWLLITYGNRQTPYNLLQYYEFYSKLPEKLKPQLEAMPRQAVYTLASREGSFSAKLQLVEAFEKETKLELLKKIRELFPLETEDKRRENPAEKAGKLLSELSDLFEKKSLRFSEKQKGAFKQILSSLMSRL